MRMSRAHVGRGLLTLAGLGLVCLVLRLMPGEAFAQDAGAQAGQAAAGRGAARGAGRGAGQGAAAVTPIPEPPADPAKPVTITVDASNPSGEPLKPVWQYYGYDECNFTTSTNARALMKTLTQINTEPVYLRTHFLLNSGYGYVMPKNGASNVYTEDKNGNPVYDFRMLDQIIGAQVDSGCRPLFEFSFMPKDLSSKPEPYFTQNPTAGQQGWSQEPKDYNKWAGLITEIAKHYKAKYPNAEKTWQWELWNEPDIFYWSGGHDNYDKLFDYTEKALHEVMPDAILGGPHAAFATSGAADNVFRNFLQHTLTGDNYATPGKKGTRLDYIAFHSKGGNEMFPPVARGRGGRGRGRGNGQTTGTQVATPTASPTPTPDPAATPIVQHPRLNLGNNLRTNNGAFRIVAGFPEYKNTPIIIGELDPEGLAARSARVEPANAYRNGPPYAAYEACVIIHTMQVAKQAGVNLKGCLTWAFMFEGKDYYEGFRTLATNGIPKAVLNTYALMSKLTGPEVPMKSSGALGLPYLLGRGGQGFRNAPDVDGIATADKSGARVLVWNYHDDMVKAPDAPVHVAVKAPAGVSGATVTHYRIDDTHSSAFDRWKEMGEPQKPSEAQIAELKKLAALTTLNKPTEVKTTNGEVAVDFSLPRYGVSLLDVKWEGR